MYNKGDKVKINRITRTRTIFQNAEVTPGTAKTHKLNVTGVITNVYQDPLVSYEVKIDNRQKYIEVEAHEMKKA